MIRLASQFDPATMRPVVAAPKSHGCCCCCCCCIVTVVGFSVVSARATARAFRGRQPIPSARTGRPVMDGWSTEPVAGTEPQAPSAAPAEPAASRAGSPEPSLPESSASASAAGAEPPAAAASVDPAGVAAPAPSKLSPSKVGWVAFAALLVPISLCVLPGLHIGLYAALEQVWSRYDHYGLAEQITMIGSAVMLIGAAGLFRWKSGLGALGIAAGVVPMAAALATALLSAESTTYFFPPLVLSLFVIVAGLVALHRRGGVRRGTLIGLGVALPIVLAIEFAIWLAVVVQVL